MGSQSTGESSNASQPEQSSPKGGGTSETKLSIRDYIDLYRVYREYAMQESNLINVRLTWILTVHGFLYATYGLTLQKELEFSAKLESPMTDASKFGCHLFTQTDIFLLTIALVGIAISLLGWRSIMAAQHASHAVNSVFERSNLQYHKVEAIKDIKYKEILVTRMVETDIALPHIRGGGVLGNTKGGHRASRWIPLMLLFSWLISIFVTSFVMYDFRYFLCVF